MGARSSLAPCAMLRRGGSSRSDGEGAPSSERLVPAEPPVDADLEVQEDERELERATDNV